MSPFRLAWKPSSRRATAVMPRLDVLFRVFCGGAFLGCALILLGWQTNEPAFKAGAAGLRATQPLTAVSCSLRRSR